MGRLSYAAVAAKPADVLALTSLTVEEFQRLVVPFEAAFQAHMATWTVEGKPRVKRHLFFAPHDS